jgi:pimeloyl-ACP methyl ester carboxylesterase
MSEATNPVGIPAGILDVEDRGTGEPVVFIHPFVTNHRHWRKLVPRLEADMRCILPTWPLGSHRRPMRGDADLTPPGLARMVIDLLDSLGIEKATLVGNDTGGAIAQIATAAEPDRVSRLILTSCDAYDIFPPKMFGYLKPVAAIPGGVGVLAASMRIPGVTRLPIAYGWVSKEPIDNDVIRDYIAPLRSREIRRDVRKVVKGLDPRHTQDAAAKLRSFDKPVLLAWGNEDRFFPKRIAERLARELPNAQLEYLPGARAFTPEDNPQALAEAISKFVATN